MQGCAFQQVAKNPFVDLPRRFRGHVEKSNPTLARGRRPCHFSVRLDPHPRIAQLKPNPLLLLGAHPCHHLHSNAIMRQITNDAAVPLIKRDIGQRSEIVPVLRSRFLRGREYVHTHRRRLTGWGSPILGMLPRQYGCISVTALVRDVTSFRAFQVYNPASFTGRGAVRFVSGHAFMRAVRAHDQHAFRRCFWKSLCNGLLALGLSQDPKQ